MAKVKAENRERADAIGDVDGAGTVGASTTDTAASTKVAEVKAEKFFITSQKQPYLHDLNAKSRSLDSDRKRVAEQAMKAAREAVEKAIRLAHGVA